MHKSVIYSGALSAMLHVVHSLYLMRLNTGVVQLLVNNVNNNKNNNNVRLL